MPIKLKGIFKNEKLGKTIDLPDITKEKSVESM